MTSRKNLSNWGKVLTQPANNFKRGDAVFVSVPKQPPSVKPTVVPNALPPDVDVTASLVAAGNATFRNSATIFSCHCTGTGVDQPAIGRDRASGSCPEVPGSPPPTEGVTSRPSSACAKSKDIARHTAAQATSGCGAMSLVPNGDSLDALATEPWFECGHVFGKGPI